MNDNIYKKGQIYYVATDIDRPPVGCEIWSDRPALIVSNNVDNKHDGVVMVVYMTTSFHKRVSPLHIKVQSGNRQAIAMCEQIHTVDKSRLRSYIGAITTEEQVDVDRALAASLGLDQIAYRGLFSKWENYIRKYGLEVMAEQEQLRETSSETAIATLRKQITMLQKERDGWRTVAETATERLDSITKNTNTSTKTDKTS